MILWIRKPGFFSLPPKLPILPLPADSAASGPLDEGESEAAIKN